MTQGLPDERKEFTLALIKSHAASNKVIVEIIEGRIRRAGLTIPEMGRFTFTRVQINRLYYQHIERPYFPDLLESVSGEVVGMILEGPNVILRWRELLGPTNPANAPEGTLRGDFGSRKIMAENVAHGSDSEDAARREIAIFFPQWSLEANWPRADVSPVRGDDPA